MYSKVSGTVQTAKDQRLPVVCSSDKTFEYPRNSLVLCLFTVGVLETLKGQNDAD